MATATTRSKPPTKTHFVRDYLDENPKAGYRAVNQAWSKAGHERTISETLVHRTRSEKGLAGNLRAPRSPESKARARAQAKPRPQPAPEARPLEPAAASKPSTPTAPAPASSTVRVPKAPPSEAIALEAEFDRLLFQIMDRGMPEVEEAIRTARRLFVLRQGG